MGSRTWPVSGLTAREEVRPWSLIANRVVQYIAWENLQRADHPALKHTWALTVADQSPTGTVTCATTTCPLGPVAGSIRKTAPSSTVSAFSMVQELKSIPAMPSVLLLSPSVWPIVSHESYAESASVSKISGATPPTFWPNAPECLRNPSRFSTQHDGCGCPAVGTTQVGNEPGRREGHGQRGGVGKDGVDVGPLVLHRERQPVRRKPCGFDPNSSAQRD